MRKKKQKKTICHKTSGKAHLCKKLNMDATEMVIYSLIYKLMSSGSQWILEHNNKDEEEESQSFNYAFLWSYGCFFCSDVCVSESQEWFDCDENGFTETDFIQNRISQAT